MIHEALASWRSSALSHSWMIARRLRRALALCQRWARAPRSGEMVSWALGLTVLWIGCRHSLDSG